MTDAIVISIVAAVSTITGYGASMVRDWLSWKRNQKKKDIIKLMSPIEGITNKAMFSGDAYHLMADSEIDRVMLFKATNGGGIINLITPMYVTCLDECFIRGVNPIKDKIQRWQTDTQYNEMLATIVTKGCVEYKVDEMEEGSLKNIYLDSGLHSSYIYYLGEMTGRNQEIYYISLATKELDGISNNTKQQIDFVINKYKVLIKDAIKDKQTSDE